MSEATSGVTSSTSPSAERVMAAAVTSSGASGPSPVPAPPPPLVQPLSPDRYRVTFTASSETCELLEMAQDLLRHAIPSGDPAQIVGRALQVLVEELVRRKFAVGRRPRASKGQADESRNIPAEVQRTVFMRDLGRCTFIGTHGRRCGERAFVEFHHLIPYAAGGRTTVENLALRCHAHNAYEAEVFYGPIRECRRATEDAGTGVVRRGADVMRGGAEVVREGPARVTDDAFRSGTPSQGRGTVSSLPMGTARAMRQYVVNHPG